MDLLLVPLRKAAGDHQLFDLSLFFQLGKLQNFFNGFLFRTFDKAAGVDDGNIGKGRVLHRFKTALFEGRHQHFPVHLIFCAA